MKRKHYFLKRIKITFSERERRLVLLLALYLVLDLLSQLPYFNILLTTGNKFVLLWLIALISLKLSARTSFLAAIFVSIFSMLAGLRGKPDSLYVFGNVIYILFVIGFIHSCISQYKEKRRKKNS